MAIDKDPEGNELAALLGMVDFKGRDVLEAGCGDGRFTWRYAAQAAQVTAIDPNGEGIEDAVENLPAELKERVIFFESSVADFAEKSDDRRFDIVIFSYSL